MRIIRVRSCTELEDSEYDNCPFLHYIDLNYSESCELSNKQVRVNHIRENHKEYDESVKSGHYDWNYLTKDVWVKKLMKECPLHKIGDYFEY